MTRKEELVVMIVLLIFLLVVALTLPAIDAEAQGRCTLVSIQYWSAEYQCWITEWVWDCTSYLVQPRPYYGSGYDYYQNRRWY